MKRIYLAGPDVFLPDPVTHGDSLKQLCLNYGFTGLFPLDNTVVGCNKAELANNIKQANIALIKSCDIVIANLVPFRGPEPDSGTVWEVGFAQALGKQVIGYCADPRELKTKTQDMLGLGTTCDRDKLNMTIEDFGLSHNLMFADIIQGNSLEECLKYISTNIEE